MRIRAGKEAAFLELAREHLGDGLAEELWALRKPAAQLAVGAPSGDEHRASRFGGLPLLDPEMPWPVRKDRPLSFLALLDLEQLAPFAAATGLPTEGFLNFFSILDDFKADVLLPWGEVDQFGEWRVLLSSPEATARTPDRAVKAFPSRSLEPKPVCSLPDIEELRTEALLQKHGITDQWAFYDFVEPWEEWSSAPLCSTGDGHYHQLGGWPDLVQSSVFDYATDYTMGTPFAAGPDDWRLVLQIDSHWDMDHDWMWGDVGVLYFLLTEANLRAGAFDQTWLVMQCT
ncbi:MAG: YwqG family protein [Segniliparus sp.]|uniref:YwqG family protein n=1 Tax=Segniliparus sp. TaxID=2804064 RepID=UPI003F411D58